MMAPSPPTVIYVNPKTRETEMNPYERFQLYKQIRVEAYLRLEIAIAGQRISEQELVLEDLNVRRAKENQSQKNQVVGIFAQ